MQEALIDAGPLVAYYDKGDKWHLTAQSFLESYTGRLITTEPVATEVNWHLARDWRVQNEFLRDLATGIFEVSALEPTDFNHIAELNEKYKDLPGDFADLSVVALSKRLQILQIVSLDADFDVYRAYGNKKYVQLFPKYKHGAK
ncbi:MAG TPA: PIN domain-containing protein [Drouetiella sp.]